MTHRHVSCVETYLQSHVHAVTEVDPFQIACWLASTLGTNVSLGQGPYASIRDGRAFDQADSAKFRKCGEFSHADVGYAMAACKIHIAKAIAAADELDQSFIAYVDASPEVNVVQVFPELGDSQDGTVGDINTFRQHKNAETRSTLNDPLDRKISQQIAVGQIENPEGFEFQVCRELKKCVIGNHRTQSKAKFSKLTSAGDQRSNGSVGDELAFL